MRLVAMLLAASFATSAENTRAGALEEAQQQLSQIQKSVAGVRDDAGLLELRDRVLALQAEIQEANDRVVRK